MVEVVSLLIFQQFVILLVRMVEAVLVLANVFAFLASQEVTVDYIQVLYQVLRNITVWIICRYCLHKVLVMS